MKKLFLNILMLMMGTAFTAGAQSFLTPDDDLVNGYSRKIAGLDFEYHSCIPGLRQSLLIRADSGKDILEWETGAPASGNRKKYTAFIWVAAIGSSPGTAAMTLTTSENQEFVFYTDGIASWSMPSTDGSSLSFNSIMTDQFGDHHGYMILRLPSDKVPPGKTIKIKVSGSRANLTSWYMTFKKEISTGVTLNPFPAILRQGNANLQLVEAAIFYSGAEADAEIFIDQKPIAKTRLKFGYNTVNTGVPQVTKPTRVKLRVVAGDFTMSENVILKPVRKWKIDLIQHSHTDIGYTRSQTEILAEHLRYIDYALDYCDATDGYPENAKFRWTCEASWPVDEYLRSRPPSQTERLIKRIREGRIEVTGMYFNFDEIPDEQILAASLSAIGRIREKGIPVELAMQNDVNGIGWCMSDYFSQTGIKYLNMGTHGHRALICFDKPTMFWWESPSGKRVLTFRAEHYMTGNTVFEIQSGDLDKFKNSLLSYLINLEGLKYPYDETAIQHSGYLTDNSPPSTLASDLIVKWNDMFEWPKISTSSAGSFFSRMEAEHGSEFPVIRGAWPDWWTDGFGSSARETSATRKAAVSLIANMGALSMASVAGVVLPGETGKKIDLANEALLFYTEHTLGYSESVREPFSQPTMEQRALKESYAWEANRRTASVGEEAMGLLQSIFKREKEPSLLVFNTLNFKRSGLAVIYIDHQLVPIGKIAGIFDANGIRLPAQSLSHRSDGTYWAVWLNDIPEFGYKKFLIRPLIEEGVKITRDRTTILENKWYRITADPSRGVITSWYDKELSLELVDGGSEYGMAEFILEELGNRSQMESRKLVDFTRSTLDSVWFDSMNSGPVFNSLNFSGDTETAIGPGGYKFEIRLFNTEKRVDIVCSIVKKSIISPESFYLAFPFKLEDAVHFTELQGGVIETGKDQIKGSSNDWYSVQNFTSLRNTGTQLVMGSGEMPLMQFGAINTGRYLAGALPQGTHLFSWPMNNYWVTNFNADQRGGHTWSYYLTTSRDVSNDFATRFGWGCRVPYLTRILPGDGTGDGQREGSFISGWPANVILISARPAGTGRSVVIQLRETGGKQVSLDLSNGLTGKKLTLSEVDVLGKPVSDPDLVLNPFESCFFILNPDI